MEEQAKAFKDDEHDGLPLDHASKFYLYRATKGETTWDVGLVLRSDHEPNTVKMKNLIGATRWTRAARRSRAARRDEVGFIGPVGLDVPMYADKSLEGAYNLTCGANKEGYHHFGFKPDRDLQQFRDSTICALPKRAIAVLAAERARIEAFRGIEVGQVFKLGTKYSSAMNCVYLDESGAERPMVMGCYGIGITRTIAAVIEQNYDADGIIWPWPVAPYHVHLVSLDSAKPEIAAVADQIETDLERAGFEVLHDDREG
jgi:prolyl-tRNA synthetase